MERLKDLRIQRGLYQKDIAAMLGVDRTTYVKYEKGCSEPNHEMLQKLADIFNTTTDYILGREEKKTAQSEPSLSPEKRNLINAVSELPAEDVKKTLEYVELLNLKRNS